MFHFVDAFIKRLENYWICCKSDWAISPFLRMFKRNRSRQAAIFCVDLQSVFIQSNDVCGIVDGDGTGKLHVQN